MTTENKKQTPFFLSDSLFAPLGKNENEILENFDSIIQSVRPLSSKQLYGLPKSINELSHLLTDERSSRRIGYMNENAMLSAYTYYFAWWNLYRLTHLFAGFPSDAFDNLSDGDFCLDLGSGPLTVVISLWLSRPELRTKKLSWYCLDKANNSLSLGEEIFLSVCARTSENAENCEPWRIIKVKGDLNSKINNKAQLITCANMFNELYYDTSMSLEEAAKKYTASTLNYGTENASFLIIEPAFPRSARFISLTRDALIRKGLEIVSPCPHAQKCPMDGHRDGKWCHFVLETTHFENETRDEKNSGGKSAKNLCAKNMAAPKKLMKLSEKSDLPKDRASVSFVFAKKSSADLAAKSTKAGNSAGGAKTATAMSFRIASDEISLPGHRFGRYACCEKGLALVTGIKNISSGDLVQKAENANGKKPQIDSKSGATVIEFSSRNSSANRPSSPSQSSSTSSRSLKSSETKTSKKSFPSRGKSKPSF